MKEYQLKHPVKATQWWKHGDHLVVQPASNEPMFGVPKRECSYCSKSYTEHGEILSNYVCPGDWIIETNHPAEPKILSNKEFQSMYVPLVVPCNQESPNE